MRKITVRLKGRSYNIIIGHNALRLLGGLIKKYRLGNSAYVITNPLIKKKYSAALERSLRACALSLRFQTIPDTEKSKSLEKAVFLLKDISTFNRKKSVFILAFGGGVVGDIAGFVASVYRRGIPYIQLPTTLLAQVDSAIGGKTAVDLSSAKNMVGAIYQPRLVLSNTDFLNSLSRRQLTAGLAEVIKYAVIRDKLFFGYLEKNRRDILKRKSSCIEHIVSSCSRIKAKIVELDENEDKGVRTILNFGHTIGHAIEAASRYSLYNHGEAVALGMLVACGISQRQGLIGQEKINRIENLIESYGLPTRITAVRLGSIVRAHYMDKKFIGQKNRFVLIEDIGKSRVVENIRLSVITEAIKERF